MAADHCLARFPLSRAGGLDTAGKLRNAQAESFRQRQQRKKAQVALASFDIAEVGPMKAAAKRQLILRQVQALPSSANVLTQSFKFVLS